MRMVDFSELIIPTLEILDSSKREMNIKEIDDELIKKMDGKNLDLTKRHQDTTQSEFSYRAAWARTYLKKYGLILNIERGIWKISDIYSGENINVETIVSAVRNNQKYISQLKLENEIDIAINNNRFIKELSQKYYSYKVNLFLGAGVSMAAKMPSWDELIARFLVSRFQDELNRKFDERMINEMTEIAKLNSDNSPISQTRFIKQNIEPEKYLDLLKKSIYRKDVTVNIGHKLLDLLADLIRNDNCVFIKDIITFNFDNLLEMKLEEKYIAYKKHLNYDENQNQNLVNIYHVHGYLDNDSTPDEIDLDRIIFSEEQYHRLYNDVYNWSNIKQINALREKTCLFIGCSLSDPNMRRILDITYDNNVKHYAIMKKEKIKLPNIVNENSEAYSLYQKFHLQNRNSYFNSLGINVIWVDDYDDIPKILLKIMEKDNC